MKTIHIQLQALPINTPPGERLFLAGNFNDWAPADPRFQLQANGDGSLGICFETDLEVLEYKITRGRWSAAEGDALGRERTNRCFKPGFFKNDIWLRVESWTDLQVLASPENILLLHPDFYIPQLGRSRRIWACLPPNYWSGEQCYPVVYLQDGQNLFDNPEAKFGSWGIDKAVNRLFVGNPTRSADSQHFSSVILIGIENGGERRIDEYSPWRHPEHGGGEAAAYLDFICETLQPFVNKHLRTLPERRHTGILGSSMGGLFALYAALERPDRFGMAGVFSPSLWFSKSVFEFAEKKRAQLPVRILLMAGQQESATMVSELLELYETLLAAGHADENLHYDLHSDGAHSEWFWAREFEHALNWLFGAAPDHRHGISGDFIQFRLDEPAKQLVVQVDPRLPEPLLEVRDYCHDRLFRHPLKPTDNRISYADWEECLYAIRLLAGGDLVFSRRVHLNQVETLAPSGAAGVLQAEPLLID